MSSVHPGNLPSNLDPLSDKFARLATTDPRGPTISPIVAAEAIKKAVFETAYEPSEELWASNRASYVKPAEDPLPVGFPELATGPHVWEGKELIKKPELWLHEFTAAELEDSDNAITHFLSLDLPFSAISKETFPLTTLKAAFDQAVKDIHRGIGLRVFRGFPVKKYDHKSQIIAFAGFSSYIGDERFRQQGTPKAIIHLRDLTKLDPGSRPAIVVKGQTAGNQVFHTDSGDIIGLLTLGKGETGGLSQLSSVGTTYNSFAKDRRDILRTLAAPWKHRGDPTGTPIIHNVDGRVIAQYGRRAFFPFFEDQSVADGVPPITAQQHLALDALHFTAEEHSLDIDLQPGDLEYFNNLTVFHARTSSTDSPENTRHLIRIWVRNNAEAIEHGAALDKRWEGLKVKGEESWPLEAWSD